MGIKNRVSRIVLTTADYFIKTIILLIVLNVGLGIFFQVREVYRARQVDPIFHDYPRLQVNLPRLYPGMTAMEVVRLLREKAFPSMTEAEVGRLLFETWMRPREPQLFTGWGEGPYHGKYINVSEHGFRLGTDQGPWPPAHEGSFVVFLFGGSTTFGSGVPDDQALGSRLQPLLEKKLGRPVTVYNFGQRSYYSTQERLLFEKLIMSGQPPDLAIFVDGMNDFRNASSEYPYTPDFPWLTEKMDTPRGNPSWGAWLRSGVKMLPMTDLALSVRQELENAGYLKSRVETAGQNAKYDEPAPLLKVTNRYFLNKRMIEAEARELSVRTLFVWEPAPTYGYDLKYDLFAGNGFAEFSFTKYGYPLMRDTVARTRPSDFLWCADIQKDVHELLYVDKTHFNPKMIEMVAGCIADGVH